VGETIPLFQLPAMNRDHPVPVWQYRQTRNLAIFILHDLSCPTCQERLAELAAHYAQYRALDAEVLAIVGETDGSFTPAIAPEEVPFPLLLDRDNTVRARLLGTTATEATTSPPVGLFACDRFGEIFATSRARDDADELLGQTQAIAWLEFIDLQCPECHPPQSAWRLGRSAR